MQNKCSSRGRYLRLREFIIAKNCIVFASMQNTNTMIKQKLFCKNQQVLRIVAVLILVLLSHPSSAQWLKLVGSIYDSQNNQPVGRLDISCIGYKSRSYSIESLIGKGTLHFSLEPRDYQLADIVVTPGDNDAYSIIKKVISRIDNNYSGKKYFLEAFFRHRVYNVKENNRTVRLTEAAVSVHQDHTSAENKRVQINEIRNSKNYAELNT
jgi:hypothetical protein